MAGMADLDLYGILEVSPEATQKEIVKAYRKKALKCHPDKNPDNPKAVELFHQLSKALEVLSDTAAKNAYDKILKAKKAAELRNRALDSKRKKLKEDLERRENAAQNIQEQKSKAQKNFQAEIERLRKEGSRLLEEEQKRLAEELAQEKHAGPGDGAEHSVHGSDHTTARIKVKWSAKKGDEENGGYSSDLLHKMFHKKIALENEIGLPENPIKMTMISDMPPGNSSHEVHARTQDEAASERLHEDESLMGTAAHINSSPAASSSHSLASDMDFESVVLMRMRQAEERKRLCEQLAAEDDDS